MHNLKIKLAIALSCMHLCLNAQIKTYRFEAKIKGITDSWHILRLPNTVFTHAKPLLEDLRIYGVAGKDTIEVPYILEKSADQILEREMSFSTINESQNAKGYYFTFEAKEESTINQIQLAFKQTNFDWRATLEGSNDNKVWFKILTDYRLLSIKNSNTDYSFTQLDFPKSKYKYYRLQLNSAEKPQFTGVKVLKVDTLKGISEPVAYTSFTYINDAKNKQSIAEITMQAPTPLASIHLNILSTFDFYRPIKIEYSLDTAQTDGRSAETFVQLWEGTLSSMELPEFNLNATLAKQLRITIKNYDNQPVKISSATLNSTVFEMIARFPSRSHRYALYFGNSHAEAPVYDLKNFEQKIPMGLPSATLEQVNKNKQFLTPVSKVLFKSKAWIWAVMGLMIFVLGIFTIKMLRETK